MKRTLLTALTGAVISTPALAQQVNVCRAAEEAMSEVSVGIVQAYNSMDFDKARQIGKDIVLKIEEGESKAKECGCTAVLAPSGQTRAMLNVAFDDNSFTEVQEKLGETLTKAESARLEAEKCWREAAKQAQAKK